MRAWREDTISLSAGTNLIVLDAQDFVCTCFALDLVGVGCVGRRWRKTVQLCCRRVRQRRRLKAAMARGSSAWMTQDLAGHNGTAAMGVSVSQPGLWTATKNEDGADRAHPAKLPCNLAVTVAYCFFLVVCETRGA